MNPKKEPIIYLIAISFIGYGIFVGLYFSFADPGSAGLLIVSVLLAGLVGATIGSLSFYWFEMKAEELLQELCSDSELEKFTGEIGSLVQTISNRLQRAEKKVKIASCREEKIAELQTQLEKCRELNYEEKEQLRSLQDEFEEAKRKINGILVVGKNSNYDRQIRTCLEELEAMEAEVEQGGTEDKLQRLLDHLEERLDDLTNHLSNGQQAEEHFKRLIEDLEKSSQEFEKLAINTGIEGAKLGQNGGVVSALAEDIQLGAEKTKQLAYQLEEGRKKLHRFAGIEYNDCDLVAKMRAEISTSSKSDDSAGLLLKQFDNLLKNFVEQVNLNQDKIYEVKKTLDEIDHKLATVISLPAGENYEQRD